MRTVDYQATVYYHHTDCGGVVYYARYLEFLEEARTALFQAAGLSLTELMAAGQWFVVARQVTDHRAPARFGEVLTVRTRLLRLTRVRVVVAYEVLTGGKLLLTAETVLASVGPDQAPRRMAETVRRALLPYVTEEKES